MTRVLIIEPHARLGSVLVLALEARGYQAEIIRTGPQRLDLAGRERADVVVVDLDVEEVRRQEVLRGLRSVRVPFIALVERDDLDAKVAAMDAGAVDCVSKPFDFEELLSRVRSALRPESAAEAAVIVTAHFSVDLATRRAVGGDGVEVQLNPREWELLEVLARHRGGLVPQARVLEELPADTDEADLRRLMAALRRKLEPDASRCRYLTSELGIGYRLEV